MGTFVPAYLYLLEAVWNGTEESFFVAQGSIGFLDLGLGGIMWRKREVIWILGLILLWPGISWA